MLIRVEFENRFSEETQNTMAEFIKYPGRTCLSSSNSMILTSVNIRDAKNDSIWFWHLDADILNKQYGGTLYALNSLKKYKGVKSVKILPIVLDRQEQYTDFDNIHELLFTQYLSY